MLEFDSVSIIRLIAGAGIVVVLFALVQRRRKKITD